MFLLQETKKIRVESEQEAKELNETFSKEQYTNGYKLTKFDTTYKNKKVKGDIVDEFYIVTATLSYDYD